MAESVTQIWARDADLDQQVQEHEHKRRGAKGLALLALAFSALGVVYGDIGTSPLYTFASIFPTGAPINSDNVILGTMSTIFWTMTSVVLVKYVLITLAADDNGEGGLMSLYALICRATGIRSVAHSTATDGGLAQFSDPPPDGSDKGLAAKLRAALLRSRALQMVLLVTVMVGSNLVLSDGVLTPAISVVSAMEGIAHQTGISTGAVVGASVGILVVLFSVQMLGTEHISFVFAPVMLLWFIANAAIGVYNISVHDASVFKALSPHYMYFFWSGRASTAWRELGSVMLCVTGGEALYADLGHFSRPSIRMGFLAVVYPSLTFTYLGQASMILQSPTLAAAAYWNSLPHPVYWPMVVLATLAAIIASQALISGAFSIVHQAQALNCFPRLRVKHTSPHVTGQIFMPGVNWMLMLGSIFVVAIFQTSEKIGNAYGLAVITVMLLDTSLMALLQLVGWGWHVVWVTTFWLAYTFITAAFLSSNLEKVPHGAWFSIVVSSVLTIISWTWYWGQSCKERYVQAHKVKLKDLFELQPEVEQDGKDGGGGASQHGVAAAWRAMARHSVASTVGSAADTQASAAAPCLHPGLQRLRLAGSKLPVARVPGIGVYYSELPTGVPPVLVRFLAQVPAIHEVVIILTNRHVPVPNVLPTERLLVRKLRFQGFFHVVARYGYLDVANQGPEFVSLIVQEVFDYLDPHVGGVTDWRSFYDSSSPDLETGVELAPATAHRPAVSHLAAARPPAPPLASSQQQRRAGAASAAPHAVQLVRLSQGGESAAGGDTVMTAASGGSRRSIMVAVSRMCEAEGFAAPPVKKEEAEDRSSRLPGEPPTAPWVQQPSLVLRLRSQAAAAGDQKLLGIKGENSSMSLPLPRRRGAVGRLSTVLQLQPEDEATISLPLPADPTRPALPRMPALAAAREPTLSLPLPATMARPPLPRPSPRLLGTQQKQQAAAQPPAGAVHVTVGDDEACVQGRSALTLQQQLRQRLMRAGSQPVGASDAGDSSVHSGQALVASAGAKQQVFHLQSSVAGSQAPVAQAAGGPNAMDESARERELLTAALDNKVAYLIGSSRLRAAPGSSRFKALWMGSVYQTLVNNVESSCAAYRVPPDMLLELGVVYEI